MGKEINNKVYQMNRQKKLLNQYKTKELQNLTPEEQKIQLKIFEIKEEFNNLVLKLHHELFSEEYDIQYDSIEDSMLRKKGINPMKNEYIQKMNNKRLKLGFKSLSDNGTPIDHKETMEFCLKIISGQIETNIFKGLK